MISLKYLSINQIINIHSNNIIELSASLASSLTKGCINIHKQTFSLISKSKKNWIMVLARRNKTIKACYLFILSLCQDLVIIR